MTIRAILNGRAILSVTTDTMIGDAVALLAQHRIGAVPVLSDHGVEGVFSERDLLHAIAADGADVVAHPVSTRMSAPAITITSRHSVLGALALMTERRIRHLPVVDDGELVGFVSIGDLVKHRIDGIEADATAMRAYIQQC